MFRFFSAPKNKWPEKSTKKWLSLGFEMAPLGDPHFEPHLAILPGYEASSGAGLEQLSCTMIGGWGGTSNVEVGNHVNMGKFVAQDGRGWVFWCLRIDRESKKKPEPREKVPPPIFRGEPGVTVIIFRKCVARGRGFSPNFGEDELRWLAGCGLKSMGWEKKTPTGCHC